MKPNIIIIRKGVACYAPTFAAIIAIIFTLLGCGQHSIEDWLFGESSSSVGGVSSSSEGGGGDYTRGTVGPLLQTKWSQGDPYNSMLPLDDGSPVNGSQWTDGTRALAGCGVIAAVQIMKYHNHPSRGNGHSEPYQTKKSGILPSVSFEVDYDWNNMLNTYTGSATEQQRNAVATLVYHYGLSRQRDFFTGNQPNNILPGLPIFFKYDKSFRELHRKFYDDTEWEKIIIEQLDASLPVLAYSASGDHAFVIDGYDNTGKLHINWGWSGKHDGYYSINALNPGNPGGSGSDMSISFLYINIKPDEGGVPAPYEMALTSFTASKTSVPQNELFTVTAQLQNVSSLDAFPGGQYGAALVNSSGNIVAIMALTTNAQARNPGTTSSLFTLSGFIPGTVNPGQYKLRMVVKHTGGDWKIAERSAIGDGIPNAINLTVTAGEANGGGYGMAVNSFTASKTSVSTNEPFTVTAQMKNVALETFPGGQYGAALVNSSGNIVAVIMVTTNAVTRAPNTSSSLFTLSGFVPSDVAPGQYKLRMVVKPTGGEWKIATISMPDIPTSIGFNVGQY